VRLPIEPLKTEAATDAAPAAQFRRSSTAATVRRSRAPLTETRTRSRGACGADYTKMMELVDGVHFPLIMLRANHF